MGLGSGARKKMGRRKKKGEGARRRMEEGEGGKRMRKRGEGGGRSRKKDWGGDEEGRMQRKKVEGGEGIE